MGKVVLALWEKCPLWFKVLTVLAIGPTMTISYFKAWHIETVKAEIKPLKDRTEDRINMVFKRQDDLQRSFNYLEERIDRNNDTLLKAILHKDTKKPTI